MYGILGCNTPCGQNGRRVPSNYGKREPFEKPCGLSPIPRLSCHTLAQALQECLGGDTYNPSGLYGDRFELVSVHQGSILAALPFLGSDRGGTRGNSGVDQRAGAVGVNACGVPYKALALAVWEYRDPVRPAAVPPVQANRLEPGRYASGSEGALHHLGHLGWCDGEGDQHCSGMKAHGGRACRRDDRIGRSEARK